MTCFGWTLECWQLSHSRLVEKTGGSAKQGHYFWHWTVLTLYPSFAIACPIEKARYASIGSELHPPVMITCHCHHCGGPSRPHGWCSWQMCMDQWLGHYSADCYLLKKVEHHEEYRDWTAAVGVMWSRYFAVKICPCQHRQWHSDIVIL